MTSLAGELYLHDREDEEEDYAVALEDGEEDLWPLAGLEPSRAAHAIDGERQLSLFEVPESLRGMYYLG